jgi:hypothetical protein
MCSMEGLTSLQTTQEAPLTSCTCEKVGLSLSCQLSSLLAPPQAGSSPVSCLGGAVTTYGAVYYVGRRCGPRDPAASRRGTT